MITEEMQSTIPSIAQSQTEEVNGIPIDPEMMFSNAKGIYKKRIEKRQRWLLAKIRFLKPFLEPDEKVILITTGCSPMSSLEQFLGGAIIFTVKRALFVFTDQRIFHIPTRQNFSYRRSIAHFLYSDCKSIKISGRTLLVQYHAGGKEKFHYIGGKEHGKLKYLFKNTPLPGPEEAPSRRVHLCPQCTIQLQSQVYQCPGCGLNFKDRKTAQKVSLLYPGGGYFYTGHWGLGIIDALGEVYFTLQFIFACILCASNPQPELLFAVFFIGVLLTLEKLITIHQTSHFIDEYIPVK